MLDFKKHTAKYYIKPSTEMIHHAFRYHSKTKHGEAAKNLISVLFSPSRNFYILAVKQDRTVPLAKG
jgi:hypothetical protein